MRNYLYKANSARIYMLFKFYRTAIDENTTVTDEGLQTEGLIETSDTDKEKVEETNPSNTSHTRKFDREAIIAAAEAEAFEQ